MRAVMGITAAGVAGVFLTALVIAESGRTVRGTVVDSRGEPLQGAVVQIKNVQTLMIRSFISRDNGGFYFTGLNPDMDYEVRASYKGRWSQTRNVSRFNSRPVVDLMIAIDLNPT